MTQAIPFIIIKKNQYYISEEVNNFQEKAEQFFSQLEDQPLSIISIVGKYRTGKSFFINNILLDKINNGFKVGSTINACTKGIWIWPELIPNPQNPNQKILIMDTEGFGGIEENINHDSKITLLSMLLSSFFIYNGVGQIDEQALQNLNLVISLAKDLQLKRNISDDLFPQLLWVVRDFSLQLVDQNGNEITSKQYLQNSLEDLKGISDIIEQKNKIRRLIKHFFKERDCITLVRPIEDEYQLQNLNNMQISQFRKEFQNDVIKAKERIFCKIQDKTINNKKVIISSFVFMARNYVEALNQGILPNIENTWTMVCKNLTEQAEKSCLEYVEQELKNKQFIKQEFDLKKMSIMSNVEKIYKNKIMGDDCQENFDKLKLKIEKIFQQFYERIHLKIQKELNQTLNKNFETVLDKLNNNQIESFEIFEFTINKFLNEQQFQFKQLDELIIAQNQLEFYKKAFKSQWEQSIQQQKQIQIECEKNYKQKENDLKNDLDEKINKLIQRQTEQEQYFKQTEQRYESEIQYLQKENDFLINQYKNTENNLKKANSQQLNEYAQFNYLQKNKENDLIDKNYQLEQKINTLQLKNIQIQKDQSKFIYEIESLKQKLDPQNEKIYNSKNIENDQIVQSQYQSQNTQNDHSKPISSLNFIKQSSAFDEKKKIIQILSQEQQQQLNCQQQDKLKKKKQKIQELKKYKVQIEQNASSIVCSHCSCSLSLTMFIYHLEQCIIEQNNNFQSRQKIYSTQEKLTHIQEKQDNNQQMTQKKKQNFIFQLQPQKIHSYHIQQEQIIKFQKTPTLNINLQNNFVSSIQSVRKQKRPASISENQPNINKFY